MAHIEPSKRTTLDWMRLDYMWNKNLTKKELYEAAKLWREFEEMKKTQSLTVIQKRERN